MANYSQNFDALSDGDLHGQDSWSGSTDYDVGSTGYSSKGASCTSPAGDYRSIFRTIDAQTNATFAVWMKYSSTSGNVWFGLWKDSTYAYQLNLYDDGNFRFVHGDGSGGWAGTNLCASSAGTWYYGEIEIRSSDAKGRARVNGGSWTDWKTAAADYAWTSINKIGMEGKSCTHYYDVITVTETIVSSIKKLSSVLQASIKKVAGLTNATTKKVSGVSNV